MTDQIAVLVLENAYFYSGENSFTGALSSKFTGTKCVFFCCSQTLNITFSCGRQTYDKTYISLYYTVIAAKSLYSRHFIS